MEMVCSRLGNYNGEGVLQTGELQWRGYAPDWGIIKDKMCPRLGNYSEEGVLLAEEID